MVKSSQIDPNALLTPLSILQPVVTLPIINNPFHHTPDRIILNNLPPGITLKESEIPNYLKWEKLCPHPYPQVRIGERFLIPEIQQNWYHMLQPQSAKTTPLSELKHYHPILDMVVNGLRFTMKNPEKPIMKQPFIKPFPAQSPQDKLVFQKTKNEFLMKGAAHILTNSTGKPEMETLWHPSFILHQTNKDRLIVHFSIPTGLNQHIHVDKFKMETIKQLIPLLNEYLWAASFDLRDAYLILRLHPDYKPLSRFKLDEFLLESDTLIFGMSPGPYVYTKLTKEPIGTLRYQGIILLVYIDDVIVLGKSESTCNANLLIAIRLFQSLGWFVKWEKTTAAARTFKFLGWILNTIDMTISVPTHRIQKIHTLLTQFLKKPSVTLKETQVILGHLTSISLAVPYIRLLTQNLLTQQSWVLRQYPPAEPNPHHKIILLADTCSDLSDLNNHLLEWNHSSLIPSAPDLTFFSDACTTGLAGNTMFQNTLLRVRKNWDWKKLQQDKILGALLTFQDMPPNNVPLTKFIHISILEMKAVEDTLQMMEFMHPQLNLRNKKIKWMTDNISTMVHLNKQGGNRCQYQIKLVARIIHWCKERNLTLTADHVPGKENIIADLDSRLQSSMYHEWQLKRAVFQHVQKVWNPTIDLFADATNFLFQPYVSRLPDPQALTTDAFSIQWTSFPLAWIHPPWILIGKILAKIFNDKAEALILAPIWPSAAWYPRLLAMSCDLPLKICPSHQALFNAHQQDQPPMQTQLAIWKVSGKNSFSQESLNRQLTLCWPDIETRPMLITKHISRLGSAGVIDSVMIPFHPQSLGS